VSDELEVHNRRVSDRLMERLFQSIDGLRGEVAELRGELRTTAKEIKEVKTDVEDVAKIIERWKVVAWVLAGIGAALVWMEAQWKVISKFLSFLLKGVT